MGGMHNKFYATKNAHTPHRSEFLPGYPGTRVFGLRERHNVMQPNATDNVQGIAGRGKVNSEEDTPRAPILSSREMRTRGSYPIFNRSSR